jgi:peroxiredoxin
LQAVYGEVRALEAEIVVLSPELPSFSAEMAAKQGLTFPIVTDHGLNIARSYGLAFVLPDELKDVYLNVFKNDLEKRNGDPSWQLPLPARFVVDRSGVIRYANADPDYTVRPEPAETIAILKTLL